MTDKLHFVHYYLCTTLCKLFGWGVQHQTLISAHTYYELLLRHSANAWSLTVVKLMTLHQPFLPTGAFHRRYCLVCWYYPAPRVSSVAVTYWGEPEQAPHYRGLRDHVHRPTDQLTDWPTMSVPFTWYWYVARAHTATLPCHTYVNSAVRSGDSYKTENADDRKAKSRDTRTTNCEAGTRERPANLFILVLPCWCCHASLGFMYVSFSPRLLHTNPFSQFPT